ncbi:acetyltransferase component of pyruvate dehydrogenase complex [Agaricicola taiwanensis]|uniref:Acetyltransferase component of pyruvate dehydrogenase complex n=1 Tax=Agaricicola taiwanensis TaxID=591372 RepID=A0A8J2YID0_9RHOB|nr:pyruvate dehydrogenase complex dihydrolipoamide acetyltransferase [Agaricicola taiwanensis]GGE44729.1 acetyltransferase component of pyruvate dehydrogenase complex [Agaricicola taiwanensis]
MPINILMPALSPTMEKGNLAKWLKKEGDQVKSGDVIAEIETDKATMEVEAVDEGTIGKIVVAEGTADVPVNETIAILLEEGESAGDISSAPKAAPKAEAKAGPAEADQKTESSKDPTKEAEPAGAKPQAAGHEAAPKTPSPNTGERVFASPLARRIAKDAGLDVSAINGSGPHGRVVKRDVEQAMASGTGKPAATAAGGATPAAAGAAPMADDKIRALFAEGSYEAVPHDNMRKVIARRLVESKLTVPHFYVTADCEIDALLALRSEINKSAPKDKDGNPAYKLSVNDLVIKALALALKRVPDANVTWTEGAMLKHKSADVGVAVSIPNGLITPVIRNADTKAISAISNEMKDLAKRARDRKLKPEEYQGGSTAVSNLGMYGVKEFSAIINPPHATILAVGAGEQRPVVKDGQLAVATLMSVTLSTDHRAVDGALGAEFLAAFKDLIEKPISLLV